MNKIRKGDQVIVLTGRDKGKRGTVTLRSDDSHLLVEGINETKAKDIPIEIIYNEKQAIMHAYNNAKPGSLITIMCDVVAEALDLIKDLKGFARPGLPVGGNGNIINAVTHSHGPSWRMIVHLTSQTEAYGVYPGGQSGNPGSRFYDNYVDQWASGQYNKLWFMKESDRTDKNVKWVMKFTAAR